MPSRKSQQMLTSEIKELMALRGWNQATLAEKMRVARSAVSRWVRGEQNPMGPAKVLLEEWLAAARENAKNQPASASA
jgi:transcriptional regulator with XRE-family HTH domain